MFIEKKIQKKLSKPASSITGDSSTSALATTPLTMAAPVGMPFFLLVREHLRHVLLARGVLGHEVHAERPADHVAEQRDEEHDAHHDEQHAAHARHDAHGVHDAGVKQMSIAGMAALMPNELNRYSAAMGDAAGDDGAGDLLVRVLHRSHVRGDDLEAHEVEQDDGQIRQAVRVERRQERLRASSRSRSRSSPRTRCPGRPRPPRCPP